MKKKYKIFFICMCVLLSMVGCNAKVKKSMTYKYSVDTGDEINITFNLSDNYKLKTELPFSISKDDETLIQGQFVTSENYNQFLDKINSDEKATLIDSGNKDGNEYIFWSYNESEYDYAILIGDSQTALVIASPVSEEAATECFERIDISKAD